MALSARFPFLLMTFSILTSVAGRADDWPQFRGPERTGVSKETKLLRSWPKEGPTLLWTYRNAGVGFTPPSIVDNRLYSMGTRDKIDYLYALDTTAGRQIWATELGPERPAGWGDGPCSTPTVDGNNLYALTTWGDLHCVERDTGKKVWNVHLKNTLQGKVLHDGRYTESPLIDGETLICTPGGKLGTVAALEKKSGKLLWRSKELTDEATSSSAIIVTINGVRQYVLLTGTGVAAVAAKDGKLLWKSDIPAAWIMVTMPIHRNGFVFVTSAYGRGCGLLKLTSDKEVTKADEIYRNKVMMNHHGGVVLVGDHLYGHSDPRGWVCQDFQTGASVWLAQKQLGKGSITCADGLLYCYSEREGTVALIKATPIGWMEQGRFTIPETTKVARKSGQIWTPPVIANGRLYLRDQDLLFCYDIKDHGNKESRSR